ncbi:DUF885 domain-containing protein [Jatrophihabitans sp.]|uniref:DUF885 domain-containing protein n=1 Tax=Jatrophihabitans sp. TaxID=1932789 RepID=UPI0030C67410|nr:hypothetical protein [Jatrophihabitans sp.]
MTETRTPTAVDAIADSYLDAWIEHDPLIATYLGFPGHDAEMPELSPEWLAERSTIRQRALRELAGAAPVDRSDRITVAALREELEAVEALRAAGTEESDLKNIASPLQSVRDCFDLTPVATESDWATVARRLGEVPKAIAGYTASLRLAASRGEVRPVRQIEAGIEQCGDNVGPSGFFATFAAAAAPTDGGTLPESLRAELARGAAAASDAYAGLAEYLRDELLPAAPAEDAVGRDLYALHSRTFLGTQIDLEETYAWGQDELARIRARMVETAGRISRGATPAEAMALLNADPARTLHGTAALKEWMQGKSDAAIAALADTHFDIPAEIRTLECLIAPTQQGGIYYTGPSEDLVTRPGRMWWSVPKGETEFATWSEISTVYHEGVPGHHLQIAQTAYRRNLLNRWRRLASWVSGHGEGWALYAERLMEELGFLDDPGDLMGMLDSQSFRAARVVLDIGIHCQLPAPASAGGGAWTYEKAWDFLAANVSSSEGTRRFELNRYLGWPGQAPSYKIGERLWLQARAELQARDGDAFDLKAFHRQALDIGSVGLDVLHGAVLGEFD